MENKNNEKNNKGTLDLPMDSLIGLLENHVKERKKAYKKAVEECGKDRFKRYFLELSNKPRQFFLENAVAVTKLENKKVTGKQLLELLGFNKDFIVCTDKLHYYSVDEICYKIEVSYFLYKCCNFEHDILQKNIEWVLDAYLRNRFEYETLPDDCLNGIFIELLNRNENYKNNTKYANITICKDADLFFHCLNYIREEFGYTKHRSKMITLHNSLINELKNKVKDGKYEHIFKFSASFLKYTYLGYGMEFYNDEDAIILKQDNFTDVVNYLKSTFEKDINDCANFECLTVFKDEYLRFDDSEKEQFVKNFDVIHSSCIGRDNIENAEINDKCSDFDVAKRKLIEYLCKYRLFTGKAFSDTLTGMLGKIGLKGCIKAGELFIEPNFDTPEPSAEKLCNSFDAFYTLKAIGFENLTDPSDFIKYCLDKKIIAEVLLKLQEREKKLFSLYVSLIVNFKENNINCIIDIHNSFIEKLSKKGVGVQNIFVSSARFLFETRNLTDEKLLLLLRESISKLKSNLGDSTDIDCVYVFFNELYVLCESFYAESIQKLKHAESIQKLETDDNVYDDYFIVLLSYFHENVEPFVKAFIEVFRNQIERNNDFYEFRLLFKNKVDFLKKTFGKDNFSELFENELDIGFLKDSEDDGAIESKKRSLSFLSDRKPKCSERVNRSCERKKNSFEI